MQIILDNSRWIGQSIPRLNNVMSFEYEYDDNIKKFVGYEKWHAPNQKHCFWYIRKIIFDSEEEAITRGFLIKLEWA